MDRRICSKVECRPLSGVIYNAPLFERDSLLDEFIYPGNSEGNGRDFRHDYSKATQTSSVYIIRMKGEKTGSIYLPA